MKIVLEYLGYLLILASFLTILPIGTAIIYQEPVLELIITTTLFLVLGLFSLLLSTNGVYLTFFNKPVHERFTIERALLVVTSSFVIIPAISAFSFMSSMNGSYIDSFFECVSGFTTTGLSVYPTIAGLPKSIIMWRAVMQWVGGLGIIAIFIFLFSKLKMHSHGVDEEVDPLANRKLYVASGFSTRMEPTVQKSTMHILVLYCLYTLLGIILLLGSGTTLFDSIALAFTAISTGGFVPVENMIFSNGQLFSLSLLMILGAISFLNHDALFHRKNLKKFFTNIEFVSLMSILTIAVAISYHFVGSFKIAFFQTLAALTGTGYSIAHIPGLPQMSIFIIIVCMLIGGSMGSTTGGIKQYRIITFIKTIPWMIKKSISPPTAIVNLEVGGKYLEDRDALLTLVFIGTFIVRFGIGTFVFVFLDYSLVDSAFQAASALGTVGLSTMPLHSVPFIGKLTLIVLMILGRLEIFPFFLLLRKFIKK
ncbi:TrkH family potassium uptake protein [Candidatus Undinarchaeota archaeon]